MKYLLFIVLLVEIVITTGCISGNQNTPVTPTSQTTAAPTILVTTTVPTTVSTPIPVSTTYLKGDSTCQKIDNTYDRSKTGWSLCFDSINASITNNILTTTGVVSFTDPVNLSRVNEMSVSVKLKIFDNNRVKIIELSKKYTVEKNGKTRFDFITEISENNPIGWTYLISIEKNPEPVTSITTAQPPTFPRCNIVSSQGYHIGSDWTVWGSASNTGASGTCIITVELIARGESVNSKDTSLYLSSGETQLFDISISDPLNTAGQYKISAKTSW